MGELGIQSAELKNWQYFEIKVTLGSRMQTKKNI